MTTLNGTPGSRTTPASLAALPGLEAISGQLAGLITVLRAEQARCRAGIADPPADMEEPGVHRRTRRRQVPRRPGGRPPATTIWACSATGS